MNDRGYSSADRRPIASRELAISQQVAAWLADRGASPNAISTAGMLAAIAGGLCLALTAVPATADLSRIWWIIAAAMAQLRLLANMFDGMVAIRQNTASPVGELYNEVPDRVSDAALFIGLGFAAGGEPLLGVGAALAAVFTAYVRAMAKVAGAPQDFCGPLAKPQRMFVLTVAALYCSLAPQSWQQFGMVGAVSISPANVTLVIILIGSLITAARRLIRAACFLRKPAP